MCGSGQEESVGCGEIWERWEGNSVRGIGGLERVKGLNDRRYRWGLSCMGIEERWRWVDVGRRERMCVGRGWREMEKEEGGRNFGAVLGR